MVALDQRVNGAGSRTEGAARSSNRRRARLAWGATLPARPAARGVARPLRILAIARFAPDTRQDLIHVAS